MTKTLTEQWREGTLPLNHYYVKTKSGKYGIDNTVLIFDEDEPRTQFAYSDLTEEVLAAVPSYSEYQALKDNCEFTHTRLKGTHQKLTQLEKKLEIARIVLGQIAMFSSDKADAVQCAKAIKDMSEVDNGN